MPDDLTRLADARDALAAAEQGLRDAVAAARDAGHTWQDVADVLGVTRQAAFKRFAHPVDPHTGEHVNPVPPVDVATLARDVAAHLADRDVAWVRSRMTHLCARELSVGRLRAVLDEVDAAYGATRQVEPGSAHTLDGTPLPSGPVEPPAVGRALSRHDGGDVVTHVQVNRSGTIVGLTLRPPATETWPL